MNTKLMGTAVPGAQPQRDPNRRLPLTSQGPTSTTGPYGPGACGSYSSPTPTVSVGRTSAARPRLWSRCRAPARFSGLPALPAAH